MSKVLSIARKAFQEARSMMESWHPDDNERPMAVKVCPRFRSRPVHLKKGVSQSSKGKIAPAVRAITAGRITAAQMAEEALAAAESCAGLNPLAHLDSEAVLAQARVLDEEARAGNFRGALHGIPITVKDIIHVAGMPTRAGSAAYQNNPLLDATSVYRLRLAGAIILGKATTHEFALGVTTPQAKNPHDPTRIPGGSSGGSAIAVAKGIGLASLGTDTRASIRIPPALSGVVGFKPTIGAVPTEGVVPLSWTMDHVAPITPTVADAAVMMDILVSPSPKLTSYTGAPINGLRVGIPEAAFAECDPGVAKAVLTAVSAIEALGAKIITVARPSTEDLELANAAGLLVSRCEAMSFHRGIGTDLSLCWPEIHDQLDEAGGVPASEYIRAQRCRDQLTGELLSVFEKVDVMAMPTSLVTAPKIEEAEKYLMVLSRNAIIWSFVGFPALSVPCRDRVNGLPVGLQLVAPPYEEKVLVAVGTAYEK